MENTLKLPADFESYPQARKAGFLKMKDLKDNGAKVVGMFCSFVPVELIYAAGTGKFLEIMANRLNVTLAEMYDLAAQGEPLAISSMCTVFAESEVISHIGSGERREDIAAGVVDSVVGRVAGLVSRHPVKGKVVLTGGLSECDYMIRRLSEKIGRPIHSDPMGRYAGALGAALIARDGKKVK